MAEELTSIAFDEQIFARQLHGGISRVFAQVIGSLAASEHFSLSLPFENTHNEHLLNSGLLPRAADRARFRSLRYTRAYLRNWRDTLATAIRHYTFYDRRFWTPKSCQTSVSTVHDMTPEILGDSRLLRRQADKTFYIQNSSHIICVSNATRSAVLKLYPHIRPKTIVVIHNPVALASPNHFILPFDTEYPFILVVGRRRFHKNFEVVPQAVRILLSQGIDLQVLCAGPAFSRGEKRLLADLAVSQNFYQANLSDSQLSFAYSKALSVVQPSPMEGFGLPAIESAIAGGLAICADSAVAREVCGESLVGFDDNSAHDLASRIRDLLLDSALRSRLLEVTQKNALRFSTEKICGEYTDFYRSIA